MKKALPLTVMLASILLLTACNTQKDEAGSAALVQSTEKAAAAKTAEGDIGSASDYKDKQDRTKTKSSMRTLPLVGYVRERLIELMAEQEENRRLCGKSYIKEYAGYICVNEIGDLIKPGYVTNCFGKLLEENGLRKIRFHDLRHSCASLLLSSGVPMKQIQEWLGHSDFSTTANIYSHLEYSSKLTSADALAQSLGL